MKTLNRVQLIGKLGSDPKIYALPSGTLVAKFSIATQHVYKDKTTKVVNKTTEWHAIVVLGHLADLAERFLQKGSCVYLDGSLKTREYEDKEKVTRQVIEIIGADMIILYGGKQQSSASIFHFGEGGDHEVKN